MSGGNAQKEGKEGKGKPYKGMAQKKNCRPKKDWKVRLQNGFF